MPVRNGAVGVLLHLAFAGSLPSSVIFSNFGPGDLFEPESPYRTDIGDLFFRFVEFNWRAAVQFTAR